MLPAKHRIETGRERASWRRFFDGRNFRVLFRPNRTGRPRFAVAVGTGVSKKPTRRNFLKRKIRGLISRNLKRIAGEKDFLIRVLPPALDSGSEELEKEFLEIWHLR